MPARHEQILVYAVPAGVRDIPVVPPEAGQLALHAHVEELRAGRGDEQAGGQDREAGEAEEARF